MSKVLQSGCLFNEVYQKFYLIRDLSLMSRIYCETPAGKFPIQLFQRNKIIAIREKISAFTATVNSVFVFDLRVLISHKGVLNG